MSLIELIGVMAVLAILAAAIVPALVKVYDQMAQSTEAAALQTLATGFQGAIARNHAVPDQTTFASTIAAQSGLRVADVQTNARGLPRLFLIDPALRVGTNATSTLPYTQGPAGTLTPVNPRLILMSSLALPLPSAFTNGPAPSTAAFNEIWDGAENTVPASWVTSYNWKGSGYDLKIQRINLGPMFVNLSLNNNSTVSSFYMIDSNATALLGTYATTNSWYLTGTVLGLYDNTTNLQARQVLQDSRSFYFNMVGINAYAWQEALTFPTLGVRSLNGSDLQNAMTMFMLSPNSGQGIDQASISNVVYQYMFYYVQWANSGFTDASAKSQAIAWESQMASLTGDYLP